MPPGNVFAFMWAYQVWRSWEWTMITIQAGSAPSA